jgi:CRP-like cAMP-binding protein
VAERLGPGRSLGEVEILSGAPARAGVRVTADSPAVLAGLRREAFLALLAEAPAARAGLAAATGREG